MMRQMLLGACVVAIAGCVAPIPERDSELVPAREWNAVLYATGGSTVSGMATVVPRDAGRRSLVSLTIAGSRDGALHPWDVHQGVCGGDGVIVGHSGDYPAVPIGGAGEATLTAELPIALAARSKYYINVHDSPRRGRVVACGELGLGAPGAIASR